MSYGVSPSRRLFTISEKAVMLFKIMLIWILSNIKKTEKVNPNDEKLAGKKSRVWALSGFIMVPQGLLLLAKGSSSRLSGCNLTPRPVPLQGCPTKTAFPASWKKTNPHNCLLWELLISGLDRELRNPQPELLKVQIRISIREFSNCAKTSSLLAHLSSSSPRPTAA